MRGKAQRDGRPTVKWMETFTRDMGKGKVRMWYLIPATPLRQLCRLEIIRGSPRQIISEIISVLPSPVAQLTDGD